MKKTIKEAEESIGQFISDVNLLFRIVGNKGGMSCNRKGNSVAQEKDIAVPVCVTDTSHSFPPFSAILCHLCLLLCSLCHPLYTFFLSNFIPYSPVIIITYFLQKKIYYLLFFLKKKPTLHICILFINENPTFFEFTIINRFYGSILTSLFFVQTNYWIPVLEWKNV